jgi:hypothetical protein
VGAFAAEVTKASQIAGWLFANYCRSCLVLTFPSLKGSAQPSETAVNGTDVGRPNEEFLYIEVLTHTKLLSWWADEEPVRFIGTREEQEDQQNSS